MSYKKMNNRLFIRFSRIFAFLLIAAISPGAVWGQQVSLWDFQKSTSKWIISGNLKVELSSLSSGKNKALHVYGMTMGGTIFSSPWPGEKIKSGSVIRVSALMNIPACKRNVYLKFYVLEKDRKYQINAISNAYDAVRSGTWQRLVAEIQVPDKANWTTYVSVIQEADGPVDIYLDDVTIQYTDKVRPMGPFAGATAPAALKRLSGVHPRLFITSDGIVELQKKIKSDPYESMWMKLKMNTDSARRQTASAFPACNLAGKQRDYGYLLPKLAFAWLITRESRYLESATAMAESISAAPSWGACAALDKDHVAGAVLFGLSVFYDWCHEAISPSLKAQILTRINTASSTMASRLVNGSHADPWWKNAYLCNQMPVALAGLAAAGFATFDELEDAPAWIQIALHKTENILTVRADDGSYIEGIGYWGYDLDSLLKMVYLFSQNLGVPLYQNEWLKNTGMFRLYMGLPRNSWTRTNQVVDFDDSLRVNWCGPDTILRNLAKNYQNHHLQWLADEVDQKKFTNDASEWLNLLWYDPALTPKKPDNLPTLKYFEDIGVVSARSDWSGNESLLVYTAGPLMGHKALRASTAGRLFADHMHPDAGHFVLFANGVWLLRDDGYWDDTGRENPRKTENHNTLVIDGMNQLLSDEIFLRKANPSILKTYSSPVYDLIKSDLTQAYRPELGLSKFRRTLVFIKPDMLIVIDDIALSRVHNLELLFHTQKPAETNEEGFMVRGPYSSLWIENFPKTDVDRQNGKMLYSGGRLTMPTIRLRKASDRWRNVTLFSWAGTETQVQKFRMTESGNKWILTSDLKTISYDWKTENVIIENR